MRAIDTVARFGGDEFVVILGDLGAKRTESAAEACNVAEKVRIAVAEPYALPLVREDNSETTIQHRCTASIGVSLFIGDEAAIDGILNRADGTMYQAKRAGKNQVFYLDEPQTTS